MAQNNSYRSQVNFVKTLFCCKVYVMKLILINYSMNSNNLVFSHQREIALALAKHFESIQVFTSETSTESLPSNVSVTKIPWKSQSPIRNTLNIFMTLYPEIIKNRKTAVFTHMTDIHAALISPLTFLLRKRHVLWYAHAVNSIYVMWSSFFVSIILSSTKGSCNLKINRRKIRYINQGISQEKFPFMARPNYLPRKILYYGRLDPSKNINLFIDLMENLTAAQKGYTFGVYGKPTNPISEINLDKVNLRIQEKNLQSSFAFYPPIKRETICLVAQDYEIFLNLFSGSLDKTLIESTFLGLPVITWNKEYCLSFGTWSGKEAINNLDFILNEFHALDSMSPIVLAREIDRRLRLAISLHSFEAWIQHLVSALEGRQIK